MASRMDIHHSEEEEVEEGPHEEEGDLHGSQRQADEENRAAGAAVRRPRPGGPRQGLRG